MKILKCKATLTEEMLGTQANDPEIHEEYIASLAPDAMLYHALVAAFNDVEGVCIIG